jgi:hypothetical protein
MKIVTKTKLARLELILQIGTLAADPVRDCVWTADGCISWRRPRVQQCQDLCSSPSIAAAPTMV